MNVRYNKRTHELTNERKKEKKNEIKKKRGVQKKNSKFYVLTAPKETVESREGRTGDIFSFLQNYNKQLSFPICHYPRDPHAVPLGCITTSLTCQNRADSLGKKTKFLIEPSVVVQNTFSYHKITGNYSCNPS